MEAVQLSAAYSVGWLTLALINSALAQALNRSGWIWFFVSFFFGPFATFLLAILGRPDK